MTKILIIDDEEGARDSIMDMINYLAFYGAWLDEESENERTHFLPA